MSKKIVIIGSTGSIGTQTLDVIRANPDDFKVVGLATRSNEKIKKQVAEFKPKYGGTFSREEAAKMVSQKDVDIVVVACRGTDWTTVVLSAMNAGKKIAMGNKEMIVEHGETIMRAVRENDIDFIPVDSEHSGIFQCLRGRNKDDIEKVVLTCSGGPFWDRKKLDDVTLEEALNHPTWKMGKKITVDSATLMNKSLEIIEAKYLFDLEPEQIEVLIHPQCIVHAIIHFKDGSSIVHMGYPDMSLPISYALYYPNVKANDLPRINLANQKLEFYEPDAKKFPSLQFAYDALSRKGNLPQKLNRANEDAVEKFFNREISFREIFSYIRKNTF